MRSAYFGRSPLKLSAGVTPFEHEIFERLLERAPTSKHEFVVFQDLDGDKATGKTPNSSATHHKQQSQPPDKSRMLQAQSRRRTTYQRRHGQLFTGRIAR